MKTTFGNASFLHKLFVALHVCKPEYKFGSETTTIIFFFFGWSHD